METSRRGAPAKNWCFTINNYTDETIEILRGIEEGYIIWGKEEAPTTGTKHLQGYIQLKKKGYMTAVKKILPQGAHIEKAKGDAQSNYEYCTKEGNFEEKGIIQRNGTRTDQLYEEIQKCNTWEEVLKLRGVANRLKFAREVYILRPVPKMELELRPWQQRLLEEILEEPDDRTIIYVYDPIGGKGKTKMCKYLISNYNAFYCGPGKGADIYHAYDNQKIILYDIPRSVDENIINWSVLEKLKDGVVFSGKYESRLKYRNHNSHIIIFSNSPLPAGVFSEDRIRMIDLTKDTNEPPKYKLIF